MSNKAAINTSNAPAAIGPYSQAVKADNTVYISGQIPFIPGTMELVEGDITAQTRQVFDNLKAIAEAAGGTFKDAVKVNISLTDLNDFSAVNQVMESYFEQPYPARACVQVAALPKGVPVEIEMILVL
ncbi:reactive intermediate/imine deaminase [Sinobacterium caligoides]|uniref:Reactive intermediate/imine deaminase n=1 Tax=Sinobacterium caligoides TaxID=933926 RepID=A0A3N2DH19_9GAMM|nr:RidA family protein [Sinobacterium caligoides]ROR99090.1 reactive intermediate/imine deaminase [Sinobacterium caligoides]